MNLNFPNYAIKCLNKIIDAGYEAYFVGGCVRDSILEKSYDDIDITTNALPDDIIRIFDKTIPTGIKHGTVTVIIDDKNIEVTTYRTENGYSDYRHPENIIFVSNLKEDLSRRDFTINALAYNGNVLVDLFGGIDDIKNKTIKAIGNPEIRFTEDALRIIRAYRFSGVLGFDIESKTVSAAEKLSNLLNNISGERIFSELKKLSLGVSFEKFYSFLTNTSLSYFGIANPKSELSVFEKLYNIHEDESIKLPLLFSLCNHDVNLIKERLKPDNNFINKLCFLDEVVNRKINYTNQTQIKKLLFEFGFDNIKLLAHYVSLFDQNKASDMSYILNQINENNEPYNQTHLKINGNHLKNMGFFGEDIGNVLNDLVLFVIDNPEKNNYKNLTEYIKKEYHH